MLLAAATALTAAAPARAEPPKTTTPDGLSPYEQETVRDVRSRFAVEAEPSPDGKLIESIEVVALDMVEKRDAAPGFLNAIHSTTRPYVIEREVLVRVGEKWQQALVDETARNLRQFRQLSLVLCIALRGSTPDKVRLVVITKDVWSIKLNANFRLAGGKLEFLRIVPSDENIAGTHRTAGGLLILHPLSLRMGGRYVIPRLGNSRVGVTADASIILNRQSGEPEGSIGGFEIAKPLYSALSTWAWSLSSSWLDEIDRRYVNAELAHFDSPRTPWRDRVPWLFHSRRYAAYASITRSWGWRWKNDLTFGADALQIASEIPGAGSFSPAAVEDFRRAAVPTSDTRVGPTAVWRTYSNDFIGVLDFESLGLQENYRLGHEAYARFWPSPKLLGSTRDVFGLYAGLQYTVPLGDGLVRASIEPGFDRDHTGITDVITVAGLRMVSPGMGIGRMVFEVQAIDRYRNYLNRTNYLGGDTRLRGYATWAFQGADLFVYNLEFRSKPILLRNFHLGFSTFLDAGDAAASFSEMRIKRSIGFGIRALLPQLDRSVLRLDWGIPITPGYAGPGMPGQVIFTFGQAFPMPMLTPRPKY